MALDTFDLPPEKKEDAKQLADMATEMAVGWAAAGKDPLFLDEIMDQAFYLYQEALRRVAL